jgi:hypothetical protein
MADLDMDGFLDHETSTGGQRGKFLRGWKKRPPAVPVKNGPTGEVNVWLHTRVMFASLWIHNLPRVVNRKNRQTGEETIEIWGNSWNCWEHEDVLKDNKRDWNTGERESPYKICPVCKMIEFLREAVRTGQLQPHDPVFRFHTPSEERLIHAAGIYNGLDSKGLTPEQVKGIADAGIKLSMAWREAGTAKCNYVFSVVDHDNPEDGVQTAIETSLLGDKTKACIRRLRNKLGEQGNWNPLVTPYAICWQHIDRQGIAFEKKYDADDRPALKLTPDIEALITGEAPDLSRIKARGRVRQLRDQLEQYALVDLPWGDFFDEAEAEDKERQDDDGDFPYGANEPAPAAEIDEEALAKADAAMAEAAGKTQVQVPAKVATKAPEPAKVAPAATKPAQAPTPAAKPPAPAVAPAASGRKKIAVKPKVEEVFIPCDDCKTQMREDWEKCPGCGATYGVEDEIKAKYAGLAPEPKPDAGSHGDEAYAAEQPKKAGTLPF